MLAWLKDLVTPLKIDDATFGQMRYLRDSRTWEAKPHFVPMNHAIEVLISSDEGGPTDEQRGFFAEIQRQYNSMWPAIAQRLDLEASRVGIASKDFDLVALTIPRRPGDQARWELFYDSRASTWHFRIQLQGLIVQGAVAEC